MIAPRFQTCLFHSLDLPALDEFCILIRCQDVLRIPLRFHMSSTFSGWTFAAASTCNPEAFSPPVLCRATKVAETVGCNGFHLLPLLLSQHLLVCLMQPRKEPKPTYHSEVHQIHMACCLSDICEPQPRFYPHQQIYPLSQYHGHHLKVHIQQSWPAVSNHSCV